MKKQKARREPIKKVVKQKPCAFCRADASKISYKNVNLLRRFVSDRGKIRARRVTGNCTQHQRQIAMAVKNARELALLPYSAAGR